MLNLLPEEIKSRHKTRSKLYSLTVVYIVIAAVFVLGPLAVTTYSLVLGTEVADYQSKIEQVNGQIGRSSDVSQKLAFLENRVASAATFQEQRQWSSLLSAIAQATPTNVVLTGIRLEAVTDAALPQTLTAAGTTSDRRAVLLFRDKLIEGKIFPTAAITSITETVIGNSKEFTFAVSLGLAK